MLLGVLSSRTSILSTDEPYVVAAHGNLPAPATWRVRGAGVIVKILPRKSAKLREYDFIIFGKSVISTLTSGLRLREESFINFPQRRVRRRPLPL